jgi:hypothetical protein
VYDAIRDIVSNACSRPYLDILATMYRSFCKIETDRDTAQLAVRSRKKKKKKKIVEKEIEFATQC